MSLSHVISISDACSRDWDVIVIGAGPAGSVAAHQLSLRKLRVLQIERKAFSEIQSLWGVVLINGPFPYYRKWVWVLLLQILMSYH